MLHSMVMGEGRHLQHTCFLNAVVDANKELKPFSNFSNWI